MSQLKELYELIAEHPWITLLIVYVLDSVIVNILRTIAYIFTHKRKEDHNETSRT